MKKVLTLFLLIILLNSCEKKKDILIDDLVGKWNTYSQEVGYMEIEIDSFQIGLFSHYAGNLRLREYELKNDTLFLGDDSIFEIGKISDSLLILKNNTQIDTLRKIDKSLMTFHSIDFKNDSIFRVFYDSFEKRAYKELLDKGRITQKEFDEHFEIDK